jgi:uncharacterized membrane protein
MKKILIALFILIFSLSVSAASIEFYEINGEIRENGNFLLKHFVSIDSSELSEIVFSLNKCTLVRVYDLQGNLEFIESEQEVRVFPRLKQQNYSLTLEFFSEKLTSKSSGEWLFEYTFSSEHLIKDFSMQLLLPKNSSLLSTQPEAIVFTQGQNLAIKWSSLNASPQNFKAVYSFASIPPSNGVEESNPLMFIFFVAIIIALTVAAIVIVLFYFIKLKPKKPFSPKPLTQPKPKDGEKISQGKKDILRTLSENEKKIILILLDKRDLTQRKLQIESTFPKSTLSRTLKKLQSRELIEIHSIGNTNKVCLSKWFKEK